MIEPESADNLETGEWQQPMIKNQNNIYFRNIHIYNKFAIEI